jgi:hypothetical protein
MRMAILACGVSCLHPYHQLGSRGKKKVGLLAGRRFWHSHLIINTNDSTLLSISAIEASVEFVMYTRIPRRLCEQDGFAAQRVLAQDRQPE